jgi:hypothetical protein
MLFAQTECETFLIRTLSNAERKSSFNEIFESSIYRLSFAQTKSESFIVVWLLSQYSIGRFRAGSFA